MAKILAAAARDTNTCRTGVGNHRPVVTPTGKPDRRLAAPWLASKWWIDGNGVGALSNGGVATLF